MNPEKAAEQLLLEMLEKQPPVNVEGIAKALSIRIEKADLGSDCSGVLVRKGASAWIGIHWGHHQNRQRFSIAHELGHFRLHAGGTYIDKSTTARFRSSESGSGTEQEEREANSFAAALLMPKKWVEREFLKHPFDFGDDEELRRMCDVFQVSSQAMMWRLKNLRLLDQLT